ncbi:organic cation transporter protein [Drosophila serrata]|uniref:organic cation transporter protein n=1 Tax=Drosophila serrata TaxID=7274 RepID=UPI000A1D232A|nr:organic cation transporter protein [Drosophila serrata]
MTQSKDNPEKSRELISEDSMKDLLTKQLDIVGSGGAYVWAIFFLCVTPNILNGFHVSSYTLLGHLPDDQWCGIPDLQDTNWTLAQKREIAAHGLDSGGCTVWDWDYQHLAKMSYEAALNYTGHHLESAQPAEVSCKVKGRYEYANPESTFVSDWDLTCEQSIQRTSAQVSISLGKFCGSFTFGILADKFGRKASFTLGALFFIVGSFFCTFSPWYSLFLAGRFLLGAASSGLFYPAFTMIVENICLKHRSWMSIAFSASYPVGMIILAIIGYFIQPWRDLQLALTIPSLLLILNCYLMNESPRWLIMNRRYDRVYKILFRQPSHYQVQPTAAAIAPVVTDKKSMEPQGSFSLGERLKNGPLKSIIELFANPSVRKLIFTSYFMFCVTSLSYYVTALNAANMSVSRYLYIIGTGLVDIPSYLVPVIMLRFTGRRITTMFLFLWTGVSLLLVLAVPAGSTTWIVAFAMLGRFGISATYSVVTLYTAELYPTEIRNSALGTCSTFAHVGSISAPFVVDILGALGWYIPTTICGCCVLVAGLLTLMLPETGTGKLSDKVEDTPATVPAEEAEKK